MARSIGVQGSALRRASGFTLVELMIVVAILGILASIAIPSLVRYIRRSKSIEATMNLRKMYDGVVSYWAGEHAAADGKPLAKQFPAAVAWTPGQGTCCTQTGQRCDPSLEKALWSDPSWVAISFELDDPHFYSYQLAAGLGDGRAAGDFQQLEASADLNCNTTYSLFRRTVTVAADFTLGGSAGLYTQNEIE
jgi:prepilin-type N-terminal cleavage/methylation domain-containing protein